MSTPEIILMSADDAVEATVRKSLAKLSRGGLGLHRTRTPRELASILDESSALIVVDVEQGDEELLERLAVAFSKAPEARVVTLCDELRTELALAVMRFGARHCIAKSELEAKLAGVFEEELRTLAGSSEAARGRIITVLSACGGSGATTVSVNLAKELHLLTGDEVLLADLDPWAGAMSSYLGIESQYGVGDLINQDGRADAGLVRSTSTACAEGLRILANPPRGDIAPLSLSTSELAQMTRLCSQAFPYTIIDAQCRSIEQAAELARRSDIAFVVMELSVVALRSSRRILTQLTDRLVDRGRLQVVVNRYHKRNSMVSLKDAAQALSEFELHALPNDYSNAIRSINFGKPLAEIAPRSALRKSLHALAEATLQSNDDAVSQWRSA